MNRYEPMLIIHPGETLAEVIASRGVTPERLVELTGTNVVLDVLACTASITPELAAGLEWALDIPASFWVNLEANHQADLKRVNRG